MKIPLGPLRGRAGRGALAITAGVGGGQLIILLVSPVLTRLYDPAAFGQYAIVVSVLSVLCIPSTLRLEAAIPLASSDGEARDVLKVGLLLTGTGAALVAAFVLVFADAVVEHWPELSLSALWCLVPGVAAFGAYELLTQYAIRQRRYGAVGVRSLVQNGGIASSQVALGFAKVDSGLNWGQIFGKLLAIGFLIPLVTRKVGRPFAPLGFFAVLRKFRRFPLLATPSALFNALGTQAPYLLIGLLFGAPAIGFLGLVQRLVAAPQALLGQAIGQVYVGEVAVLARGDREDIRRPFLRASKMLALVALPILVVMCSVPGSWYAVVFGREWSGVSHYVQAAALAFGAQFVVAPVSQTLIMAGRQGLQLGWDVFRLAFVAGAILCSYLFGASALQATWAYSAASAVSYAVLWTLCRRTAVRFAAGSGVAR